MRFSALPNHFKELLLSNFNSQVQKLYHSLLCLALYVWLFLYLPSQKLLTTCWQWGIHTTSLRHSGSACTRTHFPRHSQWIYSPMYWEQTAICCSVSESSRSILERNVFKAILGSASSKQMMRTSWQKVCRDRKNQLNYRNPLEAKSVVWLIYKAGEEGKSDFFSLLAPFSF